MQTWLLQSALPLSHSPSTLVPHLLLLLQLQHACRQLDLMPHCFPPAGHFKGPPPYAAGLTFWLELTRIGQEYLWFGPEFMVMILMDLVWVTLNSIWPHFKFLCYWLRPGVHSRWSPGCPATLATLTAPKSFDLLFSTESRTKMVSPEGSLPKV